MPGPPANDPAIVDALWARVLEAWGDDRAHSALLEHAIRTRALPHIAARYRAVAVDPDKAEVAKAKLDGIVAAATLMLLSTKTPPAAKVPLPITLSAVGVCALLLAWLALLCTGR